MLGLTLTTGITTLTGCAEKRYTNKAKNEAVKYLNGYELLRAERAVRNQNGTDWRETPNVVYWDSLLTEAKIKRAYAEGQQLIRDSADGKFFRKPKFELDLDTMITDTNLAENIKKEFACMVSAEEFIRHRNNQPNSHSPFSILENPNEIKYWNYITERNRLKEAFENGMKAERKLVNK